MATQASTTSELQLELVRGYVRILKRVDELPGIVWLPIAGTVVLRRLRIIPVVRAFVAALTLQRIKRSLDAYDRVFRLQIAVTSKESGQDEWKHLSERAESLVKGMYSGSIPRWLLALGALGVVLFLRLLLPDLSGSIVPKMFFAVVTLNPERIAELATEPGAPQAFLRVGIGLLLLLTVLVLPLVYHFRFMRWLFNGTEPPTLTQVTRASVGDVWNGQKDSSLGLYRIEAECFSSLGEAVLREVPWDAICILIVWGYHAAGPGLFVGVLAVRVAIQSWQNAQALFFVATINFLIGIFMGLAQLRLLRRRAAVDDRAIISSSTT